MKNLCKELEKWCTMVVKEFEKISCFEFMKQEAGFQQVVSLNYNQSHSLESNIKTFLDNNPLLEGEFTWSAISPKLWRVYSF